MTSAVHGGIRNVSCHVVGVEHVGVSWVASMSLSYYRTCANLFALICFCLFYAESTARLTGDVVPSHRQQNPQERLILPETSQF